MAKTTKRKSAAPGNVTNRQVAKVEQRKNYNKAVESVKNTGSADVPFSVYGNYRKAKAVINTDKGKSKVVKKTWKSEESNKVKPRQKQAVKYSKTTYK